MTETVVSIQNAQFPDQYSLTLLFVLTVAVLILFIEIGFRLGNRRHGKPVKAQASQARAVMGTTLGLLAFMLAFTFATAQTHFETRVANLAEEARLAISFSAVMMLITDLDRPMTSMFDLSSQSLVILSENMDKMLENE